MAARSSRLTDQSKSIRRLLWLSALIKPQAGTALCTADDLTTAPIRPRLNIHSANGKTQSAKNKNGPKHSFTFGK
jgi:hypothetical protein